MRNFINIMETMTPADPRTILYHLTADPDFKLNPDFAPEDNAFAMADRSGIKGIYLAKSVEYWINGKGYRRPYVAEVSVPKSLIEGDAIGRWGGEVFIRAEDFDQIELLRVIPTDAYCREEFGAHGWFERETGVEFDTGNPITAKDWEFPFRGWKYDPPSH